MARRYRHGLFDYRPRRSLAARGRKRTEGSRQKAKRERKERARGRLPAPGTQAADRIKRRYLPDTEEVRWLKRAALSEAMSRQGSGPYTRELEALADRHYRAAYKARQPKRPKPKPTRIRVKAHYRGYPR